MFWVGLKLNFSALLQFSNTSRSGSRFSLLLKKNKQKTNPRVRSSGAIRSAAGQAQVPRRLGHRAGAGPAARRRCLSPRGPHSGARPAWPQARAGQAGGGRAQAQLGQRPRHSLRRRRPRRSSGSDAGRGNPAPAGRAAAPQPLRQRGAAGEGRGAGSAARGSAVDGAGPGRRAIGRLRAAIEARPPVGRPSGERGRAEAPPPSRPSFLPSRPPALKPRWAPQWWQ